MGFTVEEINMLLELLVVEQGKQAVKIMKVSLKKYETLDKNYMR